MFIDPIENGAFGTQNWNGWNTVDGLQMAIIQEQDLFPGTHCAGRPLRLISLPGLRRRRTEYAADSAVRRYLVGRLTDSWLCQGWIP